MSHDGCWIFVDDYADEARSFAEELENDGAIKIEVMLPTDARKALLADCREPAGVLMDVDLSSVAGEYGTGPGIAQDIRVKQKARSAREFPVVRFSAAAPIEKNVRGDPTSDDLFELKVPKSDVKERRDEVVQHLIGLREVYDAILWGSEHRGQQTELLERLFGVASDRFAELGHQAMSAKVLAGLAHAPHVAAGVFCRSFLVPHGLLIDQRLLAVRLGIDVVKSQGAWETMLGIAQAFKYNGVGGGRFERWWARGLEEWWFNEIDATAPLASRSIQERVERLVSRTNIQGLVPLEVPAGEDNSRPWCLCRLGLEHSPSEYIPIDPSGSVRLVSQADFPPWIDPSFASLKYAMREKDDPRINKQDLARLVQRQRG